MRALTGTARRRLVAARRSDEGAASAFVLGIVLALMVVAGLVVDGGRAVNARAEILDDVEQAARAGANQVDVASLRSGGQVVVAPTAARQAAVDHLVALGYDASRVSVSADSATVTVEASDVVPTALLSLVFVDSFEVRGQAVARAATGIVTELGRTP